MMGKAAELPFDAIITPPAVGSAEEDELAELQQLFSSRGPYPPPRDSTIPKTTLAKLKVGEELLLHADEARQEREDRRRVREAQMTERLARAQTRREEAKARAERCRIAKEKEYQRKREIVSSVRADEDLWQADRERQQQQRWEDAQDRVKKAAGGCSSLDARLDAQEEAVDAKEREEATRYRLELKGTLNEMRTLSLSQKKAGAESSRERRTRALERAAKQQALLKRLAADEKRAEAKAWLLERRHNEASHLHKAASFKHSVAQSRANAMLAKEATYRARKADAMKERANDALVDQEKARILASNKELVAYTYRSKFASHQEAKEWGASTLLQFRSDYFGQSIEGDGSPQLALEGGPISSKPACHSPLVERGEHAHRREARGST